MKRTITILIILAGLAAVVYLGVRAMRDRQQATLLSDLETVTASNSSLIATVGATGVVRAEQTAVLAWGTSGIVEHVNLESGTVARAGDTLASLSQTSLPQNVILAQADLINAQQALDDLRNSQTATTQAQLTLYNSQQAVYEAQRSLVPFDEQRYKDDLENARQDVIDRNDDLEQARTDFEPYKDWDPTNDTRRRYEQDLIDAQNAYDEAVRVVSLMELDKLTAEANLAAAQDRQADAQRAYDRIAQGPNPDDVSVIEARIAAAQATLNTASITAPFTGTLTQVSIQPGDRVQAGANAFRLDDLAQLLVDVRLSEVDINQVSVGQSASLTFDAIPGKQYSGEVSQVSSVGVTTQGIVEFLVTIQLSDPDEDVKPGMTAAVNIVVQQLDNVLVVPNRAVRVVDGQRVVYTLENGSLVQVEVTLGASSDTYSQVVGGALQTGDLIVLNPPQSFESSGGPPFMR